MEITVRSRIFFEILREAEKEAWFFEKYRVISVNSVLMPEEPPFSQQYWQAENVRILYFDDLDDPDSPFQRGGRFMTEADAEAIAQFVERPDPRPIFVHCTAGVSRSGAIGACLNEYFNKKLSLDEAAHESFWKKHPDISPNKLVMKLLGKRLGLER